MKKNLFSLLQYASNKKGYILVPRELLKKTLEDYPFDMPETTAFLSILLHVNYRESKGCPRGCTDFSLTKWAKIFRWSQWKTYNFFQQLEKNSVLSYHVNKNPVRLCLLHYEELCGNRPSACSKENDMPRTKTERMFDFFWKSYHEITGQPEIDRYLAECYWKKLKLTEKQLAIDSISKYFLSLKDVKYTKQAANYLKDKSFMF